MVIKGNMRNLVFLEILCILTVHVNILVVIVFCQILPLEKTG